MASRLLPLFPLQVVVFPRMRLPLHIFEPRYKEMVGAALRDSSEFGIVLAREKGIVSTGCTVKVEKLLHRYPDGRMDILTRGERRFEIESIDEELAYLRAEVTFFDDEEGGEVPHDLQKQAVESFNAFLSVSKPDLPFEPDLKDPKLSFQLAQGVSDLDFLAGLQRQRSEAGRLRDLNQYFAASLPRQRLVERAKALAPTNGFAGKHAEN